MEAQKYKKLLEEIYSLMEGEELEAALAESKSAARIDAVQDLLRRALKLSSISKFNGQPYFFGGRIYEEMSWDDFGNIIYDVMRKCNMPNGDYCRVEGVLRVCRRVVSGKELRPNNAIVVFKNCVFDMDAKKAMQFSSKHVQVTQVDYDYNPDDYIYQWKDFIEEVLPIASIRRVLQEFLGSIFVDRQTAKMETMLVLKGSGSNGKSVIFETVMGILGRDNVSNFGIGALIGGGEKKKNIAFINGKRLNYCSEIQAMEFGKDSDALKALISGEPMEARPIYGENFTAYNIPLLMANANKMPLLRDWSYGMRRRICIIPFDVEISKVRQRKSLASELKGEYPAIFNWILEGRDRFIKNGYKLSDVKELEDEMDEYQSESSTVLQFMYKMGYQCRYEEVIDAEPRWMTGSSLYRQYKMWCMQNDVEAETITKFGRILSDAGYRKKRTPQAQLYGLYGKTALRKMMSDRVKKQNAEKLEAIPKRKRPPTRLQEISKPIMRNGGEWAMTQEGLARCLSIPYTRVHALWLAGKLDGMWEKEGRTVYFDLDMIRLKIRQLMKETFKDDKYVYKEKKRKETKPRRADTED